MSFLMVGATIAFSTFLGNRIGVLAYGVNLVSELFFVYILLLVAGTLIMLESMSPKLHFRPERKGREGGQEPYAGDLDSMLFFKSIARKDESEWLDYFGNATSEDILARQVDDALRQARFLSKKVDEKIEHIRIAKWVILFSSFFFVAMVAVGVYSYL